MENVSLTTSLSHRKFFIVTVFHKAQTLFVDGS